MTSRRLILSYLAMFGFALVMLPEFVGLPLISFFGLRGESLVMIQRWAGPLGALFMMAALTLMVSSEWGILGGGQSQSEASAATERGVAATAETLTRDFQTRIDSTINAAVSRLSNQADELIKQHLGRQIDSVIGGNLVAYLGDRLAKETIDQARSQALQQMSGDAFELMRSRALQYADAANRQSAFFRWTAIGLAVTGLLALGWVLLVQRQMITAKPELLTQHIDWPALIAANGPTYAFVALSEFLAIIMFRYQSKALEYMRYFSNEATNIDARRIGFFTTLNLLDKPSLKKLVERLEATERNFLIDKNQRTLELANNESEDRMFERFARMASTMWQKDEPKERDNKSRTTRSRTPGKKAAIGG